MKKIFSFLVALILVSSSFGVVSAQENLRSVDEIKAEIREVQWELDREILKNQISHRTADNITQEEKIQKEKELLPIKDKLADLDYELAKHEWRVINLRENKYQTRWTWAPPFYPKPGDIFVYYYWEGGSGSLPLSWWHANVFINNNIIFDVPWINRWNSRYQTFDSYFGRTDAKRVAVISMDLTKWETSMLARYVQNNLYNKPYRDPEWAWANKNSTNKIYCSQSIWLAYLNWVRFVDLDMDGWFIVWPVDLINWQIYGKVRYYDL